MNIKLDGDAHAIDERLIFSHIVGGEEIDANHVPRAYLEGQNKDSPVLTPFFISDPPKYIVQYSWSMAAGGIWISVHSATKLASTWDLMAVRGAYEMP